MEPKRIIKKVRDRAFSSLSQQIQQLQETINHQQHALDDARRWRSTILPVSDKLVIVNCFSGLKICLDPHDMALVPHLAFDGIWEEPTTKAWLSVLRPNQIVFDVGANFGYYGLLSAQRNFSDEQKIIFFEANPNLTPYINKTLSINGLHKNCVVENLGVSDKKGMAELTILEDFIACSSLHSEAHLDSYLHGKMPIKAAEKVKIPTVTIDQYCKDNKISRIDLMKLDIEGFEENAYMGMKAIVRNSPDMVLFLEFTAQSYKDPKVLPTTAQGFQIYVPHR